MNWIDKHEPHRRDMAPGRCEKGEEPWDHDPHEWFIKRETMKDIEVDGNRVIRTKVEIVDWFWCPGHLIGSPDGV